MQEAGNKTTAAWTILMALLTNFPSSKVRRGRQMNRNGKAVLSRIQALIEKIGPSEQAFFKARDHFNECYVALVAQFLKRTVLGGRRVLQELG